MLTFKRNAYGNDQSTRYTARLPDGTTLHLFAPDPDDDQAWDWVLFHETKNEEVEEIGRYETHEAATAAAEKLVK